MSTESLLRYARSQIGYVEKPVNRTKYGRQFGMDPELWCMMFVWACFENSGNKNLVPHTASTRQLRKAAQRGDVGMRFLPASATPKPGDLVEYDMGGPPPVNHVGIVERALGDGRIVVIEGNTAGTGPGNQRNGGIVARKTRGRQKVVNFVRPRLSGGGRAGGPPPFPGRIIKRGARGTDVKRIQARLNHFGKGKHDVLHGRPLKVNGIFGGETTMVVKVFQKHRGLEDDGEVGPKTWRKLFG
jgi:peptidoglycan hydrolase-like protein with peptidoglycan-binding domain